MDTCLNELRIQAQEWLDEQLGKNVATILPGNITANFIDSYEITTVAFNLLQNIDISDNKYDANNSNNLVLDSLKQAASLYNYPLEIYNKTIHLPTGTFTDSDGIPVHEADFLLTNIYPLIQENEHIYEIDIKEPFVSFLQPAGDNNTLFNDEEFCILLPFYSQNAHCDAIADYFIKNDYSIDRITRPNNFHCCYKAKQNISLPISVTIPARALDLSYTDFTNKEFTVSLKDKHTPKMIPYSNGDLLSIEFALSDTRNRYQIVKGDIIEFFCKYYRKKYHDHRNQIKIPL